MNMGLENNIWSWNRLSLAIRMVKSRIITVYDTYTEIHTSESGGYSFRWM